MPTELQRIETLEREVAELRAKVQSIETDLALIPGLITTGFRQVDSRFFRVFAEISDMRQQMNSGFARVAADFNALRAHVDEGRDATIRAVAEIIKNGK